jgi:hypothetical protein
VLSGTLPRRSTLRWYLSVFTPARRATRAQTRRAVALTHGMRIGAPATISSTQGPSRDHARCIWPSRA